MSLSSLEQSMSGGVDGPWLRYELHHHSNDTVGGYVSASDTVTGAGRTGVVIYRTEAEMLTTLAKAAGSAGVHRIVVLDGEEIHPAAVGGAGADTSA